MVKLKKSTRKSKNCSRECINIRDIYTKHNMAACKGWQLLNFYFFNIDQPDFMCQLIRNIKTLTFTFKEILLVKHEM